MDAQLNAIVEHLQAAGQHVRQMRSTLTPEDWTRRPGVERWSAAECVAHLNLASEALLPLLRTAVNAAREGVRTGSSRYRRGIVGWLIWNVIAPSSGLRMRTRSAFVPSDARSPEAIVADFERLQSEVIACVRAAEGLPIDRVTLVSPFDARVKCNLYAAMTLVPRHQHRHLLQAHRAVGSAAAGTFTPSWGDTRVPLAPPVSSF